MIQLTQRFSVMINYDTGSIGCLKRTFKSMSSALFLVRLSLQALVKLVGSYHLAFLISIQFYKISRVSEARLSTQKTCKPKHVANEYDNRQLKGHESKRILNSESPSFKDQPNLTAIQGDSSLFRISMFFFHLQCLSEFTDYFKLERNLSKKRYLIIELVKV